jgi:hypothetical protein
LTRKVDLRIYKSVFRQSSNRKFELSIAKDRQLTKDVLAKSKQFVRPESDVRATSDAPFMVAFANQLD